MLEGFLWCGLAMLVTEPLFGVLTSLLGQLYANILWFSATAVCCSISIW